MNRDETIKDIETVLDRCCGEYDDKGNHIRNLCRECEYWSEDNCCCCSYNKKEATALYDANYRRVGEGEMVLEKHEYDKLRLAQYDAHKTINEIFSLSLEKIEEAKKETAKETARDIFVKVFTTLSKCFSEDGFYATESDSDVSINGNVVWFELEKLANAFGIEIGEVE